MAAQALDCVTTAPTYNVCYAAKPKAAGADAAHLLHKHACTVAAAAQL